MAQAQIRSNSSLFDSRIQQMAKIIDSQLPNPELTVVRIARELHSSPSRLRFLMRTTLGEPPKRYILMKRMLRAEVLLRSSFLSVKEVMAAVGMSDPTHFGREFRRLFGAAPREYRRQSLNDPLGRPTNQPTLEKADKQAISHQHAITILRPPTTLKLLSPVRPRTTAATPLASRSPVTGPLADSVPSGWWVTMPTAVSTLLRFPSLIRWCSIRQRRYTPACR